MRRTPIHAQNPSKTSRSKPGTLIIEPTLVCVFYDRNLLSRRRQGEYAIKINRLFLYTNWVVSVRENLRGCVSLGASHHFEKKEE